MRRIFCASIAILFLLAASALPVFAKSYRYPRIDVRIAIQDDGSFLVEEQITLQFEGQFHFAFRDIAKKDLREIRDVSVRDETEQAPLRHGSGEPDPNNPASWGTYTIAEDGDSVRATWYFDLHDTAHVWTVRYRVLGALRYFDDHDELYWNAIFPDRDVLVESATALVTLPVMSDPAEMRTRLFTNANDAEGRIVDAQTFSFSGAALQPNDDFTIVAGWPPGLINRTPDRVAVALPILLGFFSFLGPSIFVALRWWRYGRDPEYRRTVIAQYEPPGGLRPAVVEALMRNRVTPKALAATVLDLAVRGYLKMIETRAGIAPFRSKQYTLELQKHPDTALLNYERDLLAALFPHDLSVGSLQPLTTLKKGREAALAKIVGEIEKDAAQEAARQGFFLEKPLAVRNRYGGFGLLLLVLGWIAASFLDGFAPLGAAGPYAVAIAIGAAASGVIVIIFGSVMPQRTPAGAERLWELFGFKLYLSIAERFRLAKAPIDKFAAFLPYAIVFGVEKKWAKRFEGLTVPQ